MLDDAYRSIDLRNLLAASGRGLPPMALKDYNRIIANAPSARVTLGGRPARLHLAEPDAAPPRELWAAALASKAMNCKVFLPGALLWAIYADRVNLANADAALVDILVRHALAGMVAALEARVDDSVAVTVSPASVPSHLALPVGVSFECASVDCVAYLDGNFSELAELLDLCELGTPAGPALMIPVPVEITSRPATLLRSEAADIAAGDLLYLPDLRLDDFLVLKRTGQTVACVAPAENSYRITRFLKEPAMSDEPDGTTTETELMPGGDLVDDLVLLSVEMGRTEVTIGAAQKWREGMAIDLGEIDTGAATLRVNGRAAATGRLVVMGDGVGFQIRSIIHHGS